MESKFVDLSEFGTIAFLNGQSGLHESENAFYKYIVGRHDYPIVLDDLFNDPKKIKAIKYLNPQTIVIGTTGTYRAKIDLVVNEFKKLKWLPKKAIFTMGEEYFYDFLDAGVIGYKLYPYTTWFKEPPVVRPLSEFNSFA